MDTARSLTENLAALLRREHHALAEFLVALADFDRRRCWVELGYSSLFYFLHRELGLSKASAQYRKVAAELIQEIPAVVEPLRDGRLCLTSIIEAAKVVTAESWETVLPRFYGLSRREAMEVVAGLQPHPAPPARTIVTAIQPSAVPIAAPALRRLESSEVAAPPTLALHEAAASRPDQAATPMVGSTVEPAPASVSPALAPHAPAARPLEVVPLTAEQCRLHATVSSRFMRKLEAACDALSHARPGATPGEILEAGLDLLLEQAARRRGQVNKPRKGSRPVKADRIPADVKREVWERDGGKCQWPVASGGTCGSTRHLELDHVRPLALGGSSTPPNLRILCRAHNGLSARLALGDQTMDRYTLGLRGIPRRSPGNQAHQGEPPGSSPP